MVKDADVVVIGSGGFGAATAYFLMRDGGRRVALLDRHALASQTSPRAAGNAAMLRSTDLMSGSRGAPSSGSSGSRRTPGSPSRSSGREA